MNRDNREVDNQLEGNQQEGNQLEGNRLEGNQRVEDKQLVDSHEEEGEEGMDKELRDDHNHDDREVGSVRLQIQLSGERFLCHCDYYSDPLPFFLELWSQSNQTLQRKNTFCHKIVNEK